MQKYGFYIKNYRCLLFAKNIGTHATKNMTMNIAKIFLSSDTKSEQFKKQHKQLVI